MVNPLFVSRSPVIPPITARTHHHGNKTAVSLEAVEQWCPLTRKYIICLVDNNINKTNSIIIIIINVTSFQVGTATDIHNNVEFRSNTKDSRSV